MAFTEAQLVAQLDSASTGRTINIETLIPGHIALRRELEDWTALLAA